MPPPRSQARKAYKIVQWTEINAGDHFAALEQPDLLLADRRQSFAHKLTMTTFTRDTTAVFISGIIAVTLRLAAICIRIAAKRTEQEF